MTFENSDFLSEIRITSAARDMYLRLQPYLSHFCSFEYFYVLHSAFYYHWKIVNCIFMRLSYVKHAW